MLTVDASPYTTTCIATRHLPSDRGLRDSLGSSSFGEKYYDALQYAHVDLVTDPIERVTSTSVVTAGDVIDVDAIVPATGFETTNYLSGLDVIGIGGESLHDRWGMDPRAYLGVGVSWVSQLLDAVWPEHQSGRQLDHLHPGGRRAHCRQRGEPSRARGGYLDVRPEVEHRFNEQISAYLERTIWTRCDSYYRSPTGRIVTQWPHSELDYARAT